MDVVFIDHSPGVRSSSAPRDVAAKPRFSRGVEKSNEGLFNNLLRLLVAIDGIQRCVATAQVVARAIDRYGQIRATVQSAVRTSPTPWCMRLHGGGTVLAHQAQLTTLAASIERTEWGLYV
jgi:hypothetical protein